MSHNSRASMIACLLSIPSSLSPNLMSTSSGTSRLSLSSWVSSSVTSFLWIAKLCRTQHAAITFLAFSGLLIEKLKTPESAFEPPNSTLHNTLYWWVDSVVCTLPSCQGPIITKRLQQVTLGGIGSIPKQMILWRTHDVFHMYALHSEPINQTFWTHAHHVLFQDGPHQWS